MELLIRQYSESDVIPIWQLLTKEAQCPGWVRSVPFHLQQCRNLLHRQSLCLVAQVEGRVAGFLLLRPVGEGGWEQFATIEVVVTPKWRRQGIGTALLERAKREITAFGHCGILLAPLAESAEAMAFFVSQGFGCAGVPIGTGMAQGISFWNCPQRAAKIKSKPVQKKPEA